jgi:hypothetical protein
LRRRVRLPEPLREVSLRVLARHRQLIFKLIPLRRRRLSADELRTIIANSCIYRISLFRVVVSQSFPKARA